MVKIRKKNKTKHENLDYCDFIFFFFQGKISAGLWGRGNVLESNGLRHLTDGNLYSHKQLNNDGRMLLFFVTQC